MIILLKRNKIVIGSIIILVAFSVFTLNAFARRNSKKWTVPSPTPTLSSSPSPTIFLTPKPTIKPTVKPTTIPTQTNVYITYYGWNDNDPPGTAIAYPINENSKTIHNGAGGTGTFSDPVTFASDAKTFSVGAKIYVPYIKKYAIMEDFCASCKGNHIDIWVGGNGANEQKLIACEEKLTRSSENIELNPPNNRPVDTSPLFNSETSNCIQ